MDPITALLHDVLEDIRPHDDGAPAGYILLWALGVPIPVLFLFYLLRGCT